MFCGIVYLWNLFQFLILIISDNENKVLKSPTIIVSQPICCLCLTVFMKFHAPTSCACILTIIYHLDELFPILICSDSFLFMCWLEWYFVSYEYSYPCLLLTRICLVCLFLSFSFVYVCLSGRWISADQKQVGLLKKKKINQWICFF